MGTILCVILILTPFNIDKVHGKFVSVCKLNFRTMFIKQPKLRYCLSEFDLFMTLFVNSAVRLPAQCTVHTCW